MLNSLRALASLSAEPSPRDRWIQGACLAIVGIALGKLLVDAAARRRCAGSLPPAAVGLMAFLAATASLTLVYPHWQPNRSAFGGIGLAVAAVPLLGAAHPALPAALVAVRLGALATSPRPPREVRYFAPETGSFMDFEKLVRLERLMVQSRSALRERFPRLPPRSVLCLHHMPKHASYAYGDAKALHVWYGDTTLRWMSFQAFDRDPSAPLAGIVEFNERPSSHVAIVEPEAMRRFFEAQHRALEEDPSPSLLALDSAEAAQTDTSAWVFRGMTVGLRAFVHTMHDQDERAMGEALRSIALSPHVQDGRMALAIVWTRKGRFAEAKAQLDTVLGYGVPYPEAAELRRMLIERMRRPELPAR
jgi:hypothetical protein